MRPLWVISMKPSSMSMLGVPYSPMVPSFTRWIDAVALGDGVEQVERAHHVVDLGVDGMGPVDHRVRGAALLGEVHDGLGLEALEQGLDRSGGR